MASVEASGKRRREQEKEGFMCLTFEDKQRKMKEGFEFG